MKLIPLTNGLFAKVDDDDYDWLSLHQWFAKPTKGRFNSLRVFYAARSVHVDGKTTTVYMHREITCCSPGCQVDHDNRERLDNQRHNLIVCSQQANLKNQSQLRSSKKCQHQS